MSQLTPKQQQIYDYILTFADEHGYPPSVREIAEAVDLKSPSTVHFHLKGLRAAGLISQAEGKTRAITINSGLVHGRKDQVPVVGNVAAGSPILAQECIEDYLTFHTGHPGDVHFALRVRGESMLNAGILPGDLVVVRQQEPQKAGERMLFLLEGQTACGIASWEQEHLWLTIPDRAPVDGTEVVLERSLQ